MTFLAAAPAAPADEAVLPSARRLAAPLLLGLPPAALFAMHPDAGHALLELVPLGLATALFLVARQAAGLPRQGPLLCEAAGTFAAALLDVLRLALQHRMPAFAAAGADADAVALLLWLGARTLQGAALLAAPGCVAGTSAARHGLAAPVALALASLCAGLAWSGTFPALALPGGGGGGVGAAISPFWIAWEWFALVLLAGAAWRLVRHREAVGAGAAGALLVVAGLLAAA